MATQLSFMNNLFPCASAVCQGKSDAIYKVTTAYYPHGKSQQRAWVSTEILCKDCVEKLRQRMKDNPFIEEYNDISIKEA